MSPRLWSRFAETPISGPLSLLSEEEKPHVLSQQGVVGPLDKKTHPRDVQPRGSRSQSAYCSQLNTQSTGTYGCWGKFSLVQNTETAASPLSWLLFQKPNEPRFSPNSVVVCQGRFVEVITVPACGKRVMPSDNLSLIISKSTCAETLPSRHESATRKPWMSRS